MCGGCAGGGCVCVCGGCVGGLGVCARVGVCVGGVGVGVDVCVGMSVCVFFCFYFCFYFYKQNVHIYVQNSYYNAAKLHANVHPGNGKSTLHTIL